MKIQKHLSVITAAALMAALCGCSAQEGTASVAETDEAVASIAGTDEGAATEEAAHASTSETTAADETAESAEKTDEASDGETAEATAAAASSPIETVEEEIAVAFPEGEETVDPVIAEYLRQEEEAADPTSTPSWTETDYSATMYTTQDCSARLMAIVGSNVVKAVPYNTQVTVVAKTDTGYYKLSDGSFIHSDYLSTTSPQAAYESTPTTSTTSSSSSTPSDSTMVYNSSFGVYLPATGTEWELFTASDGVTYEWRYSSMTRESRWLVHEEQTGRTTPEILIPSGDYYDGQTILH